VGAGPAGLSAAAELKRLGVERVLVADREAEPGGVPRHSWHTGYGLRDLRRVLSGPAYARALAGAAAGAGADIRTASTVTEICGTTATITSPRGVETVQASAVLLATGCRERPRAARLVPGDRPSGVMTTGELQQRVYLGGEQLSGRALVVGAEHVSFSAAVTLAHAGARVVALVTEYERQQSYAAFRAAAALRWRLEVWTSTLVRRVAGADGRLSGVELAGTHGGTARFVPCEILVFSADWIPDCTLARAAGLSMDPGTRGPAVDTALATSADGVFAAGNLVHAAETADVAALSGRHAARQIAAYLRGRRGPVGPRVPVEVAPPLLWISPNAVAAATPPPPLGRFTLRAAGFGPPGRLEVRQDGRLLGRSRPQRMIPGRPVHLPASWLPGVDPGGGPVRVARASHHGPVLDDLDDLPGEAASTEPGDGLRRRHMGRIVVTEFVSLDGVFESPGPVGDFEHAGWTFRFNRGADGDRFKFDEHMAAEAQLLGRVTYEGFAAAWPSVTDDVGFADRMNSMPKYVVSTTLEKAEWNNSTVIGIDDVARVRESHPGILLVAGSGTLVRGLLERGLVDEVRLMVFPVVLGSGQRLFDGAPLTRFTLASSQPVGPDGVLVLTYLPA
jgi:thioredoxin reductase/dihydrofolate reductase